MNMELSDEKCILQKQLEVPTLDYFCNIGKIINFVQDIKEMSDLAIFVRGGLIIKKRETFGDFPK